MAFNNREEEKEQGSHLPNILLKRFGKEPVGSAEGYEFLHQPGSLESARWKTLPCPLPSLKDIRENVASGHCIL